MTMHEHRDDPGYADAAHGSGGDTHHDATSSSGACCAAGDHAHDPQRHAAHVHPAGAPADTVIDPVCSMRVDPATAKHRSEH
ncbi:MULTISPECIES: hypothetical protein, partial [Metallibacterium]|uniref:hypothetical protein n=1 Tax=Metallibacterium TaxID=1218803 RepID=UPI00262FB756